MDFKHLHSKLGTDFMELCEWHSFVHSFHRYFLSLYPGTTELLWDSVVTGTDGTLPSQNSQRREGCCGPAQCLPEEGTLP